MLQRKNSHLQLFSIIILALSSIGAHCKELKQNETLVNDSTSNVDVKFNEKYNIFNTIDRNRIEDIPYEKFERVKPSRFLSSLRQSANGNFFTLYNLFDTEKLTSPHPMSHGYYLAFESNNAEELIVDIGIADADWDHQNVTRNIFCLEFAEKFKDCKIVFGSLNEPEEAIFIRSRNDVLFYIMYKNSDLLMFRGRGKLKSPEYIESAREAYQLFKTEKNAPELDSFTYFSARKDEIQKVKDFYERPQTPVSDP